ncbi:MAG: DUF2497 domain-containing protein [Pseudomonadota bacterium]
MTRPVAAVEPTMEDILASIRKIIAEEPAAVPASASGGGPLGVSPASVAPAPAPRAAPASLSAPERSSEPARTSQEQPHKPGGSALFGRLSEALRGPSATAPAGAPAAVPRAGVAGIDDDLADMLVDPAPRSPASLPLRDAAATRGTGLPLPTGRRESPLGGPLVSAPPPPPGRIEPSLGAFPAQAGRDSGSRPADLGTFVPARPDAPRPADPAGAPPFGRRINESAPPPDVVPPPQAPRPLPEVIAAMPAPAAASPAPAPAASPPAPATEKAAAVTAGPVATAAPMPETRMAQAGAPAAHAAATAIAATPAAPPATPSADQETTTDPDTTAAAASALSMLAKGLKASSAAMGAATEPPASEAGTSEPEDQPAAPRSSVSASGAAGPAASGPATEPTVPRDASAMRSEAPAAAPSSPAKPTAGEVVGEATAASQPPAAPAAAAAAPEVSAPIVAEPARRDEPPAAPASAPPSAISLVTAAAAGDVRTLEDTVAELLRPMLRQWLDDNMPRIVEKALRVEIAGRPKPPAGPAS